MIFHNAIVRMPGENIVNALTTQNLGKPEYIKALRQHYNYVNALEKSGLKVTILKPDIRYPDATFVEDTAVLTERCAILTNLGAKSRRGEEEEIREVLEGFFTNIEAIRPPGTLEGGDVMRAEDYFYIGLSERTNEEGAKQLIDILSKYNYRGITVPLKKALHLKTGLAYIGENTLIARGEFINSPIFKGFNIIEIDDDERYAANCIRVNDYVLLPEGYPKIMETIQRVGYKTIMVDVSEFKKIDGGLSCLSLRF